MIWKYVTLLGIFAFVFFLFWPPKKEKPAKKDDDVFVALTADEPKERAQFVDATTFDQKYKQAEKIDDILE